MRLRRLLAVLGLAVSFAAGQPTPGAPVYTAASIANSAANVAGYYSPNSFLTIYGQNLAYVVRAIQPGDIHAGQLPIALTGAEIGVIINLIPANLYYASPGQVNVLIPPSLSPGPAVVQLQNQGLYGPAIKIVLDAAAPVLFQSDATTVIATHGNGPVVTADAPAQAGEVVVLYATGLGATSPATLPNQIPTAAARIIDAVDFQVVLNGVAVDPRLIQYAGVTPGYAGLYQINLQLPADCPPNPEIQIGYSGGLSLTGRFLPVK
ncbi:MAG TPA: hypothetical protein VGN17_21145 [Bryobacteraceae bacterium]